MDDIEKGLKKIQEKIEQLEELKAKEKTLSDKVRDADAELLARMAQMAKPVVKNVGLSLLKTGKQDTKGELYHPQYYKEKMIILGKCDPSPYRPDKPTAAVVDQFCTLSENGAFFEVMYSDDGFLTDSYLNPVSPRQAIDQYGYDIMFMLYQALRDYLKAEDELLAALEKVIGFIFIRKESS